MVRILVLVCLAIIASARWSWGRCEEVPLQQNFDVSNYVGVWYERFRDINTPFEYGDCASQSLTPTEGGKYIDVVNAENVKGEYSDIKGTAYCEEGSAQCYVSFGGPYGDYRVISTDYNTYTQVYSCTNLFFITKIEYFWLMTRDPDYSADSASDLLEKFLKTVDVPLEQASPTNQKNCIRS